VPADRRARGLRHAEQAERRAAASQQPARLPGLAGDGGGGGVRRPGRVPQPAGAGGGAAVNEHFVRPPDWGWYIVFYFFLGGIAGGAYLLGTVLRLLRAPGDEPLATLAFVLSFAAVAVCPVLLTLDLGKPERFWHMLVDPTG